MEVTFVIPGQPVAWQRPDSKGMQRYDTPRNRAHKKIIGYYAREVMKGADLMTGPLRLRVDFFLKTPKCRQDRSAHYVKPDLDNLTKIVKDAMNGIVWKDDAQVYSIEATKHYSDTPGCFVQVIKDERVQQ